MTNEELREAIIALVEEQNNIKVTAPDTELDIDSFTIVLLSTFAETKLDIELDLEKLDFDNFKSILTIEDVFKNPAYHV